VKAFRIKLKLTNSLAADIVRDIKTT
jgi:hypothetical protein